MTGKMTKKRILVVSLALNALLFICICGVAFHYRGKIIEKVQKELGMYNSPSEEYLANFNNEPLEAVNDSLMIGADSTITCLFLGNSLTYCGVAEEEPDKTKRGLTSTSVEKDYVHVLLKTISEDHNVNIKYSILNIAQFERTFTKHSFEMGKLALAENKQPDYLFVQIGENVAKDDIVDAKKYEVSKGTIVLFDQPEDTEVTFIELVAPAGYYIDRKPFIVNVGHDSELERVENYRSNSLIIITNRIPDTGYDG